MFVLGQVKDMKMPCLDKVVLLDCPPTKQKRNKRRNSLINGLIYITPLFVGIRLQEIAKNTTTGGEYAHIGELYGFPILVKTENSIREGVEVKQNRFFIEGEYKYTYNNGQIAMADHKAAATNFLNALDRIPKLMEQYKSQNAAIEKDLPTLREIVGGTWKKEEELKQLKSEVAMLERKIQQILTPPEQAASKEVKEEREDIARPQIQTSVSKSRKGFSI